MSIGILLAAIRRIRIKHLVASLLEAFGTLWLFLEVSSFFSQEFSSNAKEYWWLFGLLGFVIAVYKAWPKTSVSVVIPGTDCKISLRVCNLLKVKDAAYIVSCNRTFDTSIEDGTISKNSVQGQITEKYFSKVDVLDREIAHSLTGQSSIPINSNLKSYGKRNEYPVGTVAHVVASSRSIYFVAMAQMNSHKRAQATKAEVMEALPILWEYIRTRGELEMLCAPVLGSGFSRINTTREDLIREMVRSFIPAARSGTFCKGLVIAISSRDYADGHIDIEKLQLFVQHECEYGTAATAISQAPVGTPHGPTTIGP